MPTFVVKSWVTLASGATSFRVTNTIEAPNLIRAIIAYTDMCDNPEKIDFRISTLDGHEAIEAFNKDYPDVILDWIYEI